MKRKKHRVESLVHRDAPWTPFAQMTTLISPDGSTRPVEAGTNVFKNNHYQVYVYKAAETPPFGNVIWLSIKRLDRKAIHDWRDLQRIKNELLAPEIEAVELYPSEERVVDTANQYHLFAFVDGYKMPFGYPNRLVVRPSAVPSEHDILYGSEQRDWPAHSRPHDALTNEELNERARTDPESLGLKKNP